MINKEISLLSRDPKKTCLSKEREARILLRCFTTRLKKRKLGKGKRGNERERERTPGKPLTRKCQSLRKEKTIESRDREEQKKKPGKLKQSLFLILPLFLSTLPSLVPRDARCARASRRDEVEKTR